MDSVSENNCIVDIDCLQTMRGLGGRDRRQQDASLPMIQNMDNIDEQRSDSVPEFCIDAASIGNVARFINHSCEPNLFIQCVLSAHQDIKLARVVLFPADNIPPFQSTACILDIVSADSFPDNEEEPEFSFGDQWLEENSHCCKFGEELSARGVRISKAGLGSTLSRQNFRAMEFYDVLLSFGIVDFFQNYGVVKRIVHAYKSLQFDRKMIAAVNPKAYSSRFQEFISDIFKEDESLE